MKNNTDILVSIPNRAIVQFALGIGVETAVPGLFQSLIGRSFNLHPSETGPIAMGHHVSIPNRAIVQFAPRALAVKSRTIRFNP